MYVVVNASDLPFRMLCRKYNASACYSPMIYADKLVYDAAYREEVTQDLGEGNDHPLILQFAANDPATLLAATQHIMHLVDAVDINLGCPQHRAKLEHFGSYLTDKHDWPLIADMVRILKQNISIPVTAKIRLLSSLEETRELCKLLEESGIDMIAVHGR